MKFLLDQDVYAGTLRFLQNLGHDAVPVAQIGLAQASDTDLLKKAQELERLFVTRDRDFGGLVFVSGVGAGVIYLRMLPSTQQVVHQELEQVLELYSEETLRGAFVVVEPGRHRFRRIPERKQGDRLSKRNYDDATTPALHHHLTNPSRLSRLDGGTQLCRLRPALWAAQ
jgi:predicted nuclease of predicted toxin-antitoxin system